MSLKIKVFTDLQIKAELYEINWTLFLSHCAQGLCEYGVLTRYLNTTLSVSLMKYVSL